MADYVEESDLLTELFDCCGDEDLYPFKCPRCTCCMVFCYECDTLYDDLQELTARATPVGLRRSILFTCACGYKFEPTFMQNALYRVQHAEWIAAGGAQLLSSSRKNLK